MSASFVWLDGRIMPRAQARIRADDWGFLYGDSLFETVRVVAETPLAWGLHMRRLEHSARLLKQRPPWKPDEIRCALDETLAANGLADAAARITLTRGRNPSGFRFDTAADPSLLVTVRPFDGPTRSDLRAGIRLATVRVQVREGWPRYRTKSGNYLDFLLALDGATAAGADEALLVDRRGRILEGARSNVFVAIKGRLLTPPVRLGILPGVMRSMVLLWARRGGVEVVVRPVLASALRRAEEVFMTNCLWGIMPVRAVDGRPLREPPGPLTLAITARHERWIEAARRRRSRAARS